MGIIPAATPAIEKMKFLAPRRGKVTADEIIAIGRINIQFYPSNCNQYQFFTYEKLPCSSLNYPTSNLDLLWKTSFLLKPDRLGWLGMMQVFQEGDYPGKLSNVFLPVIDREPSDVSCIYSTGKFAHDRTAKYGITPVLRFDQPLWWEASSKNSSET